MNTSRCDSCGAPRERFKCDYCGTLHHIAPPHDGWADDLDTMGWRGDVGTVFLGDYQMYEVRPTRRMPPWTRYFR